MLFLNNNNDNNENDVVDDSVNDDALNFGRTLTILDVVGCVSVAIWCEPSLEDLDASYVYTALPTPLVYITEVLINSCRKTTDVHPVTSCYVAIVLVRLLHFVVNCISCILRRNQCQLCSS